MEKNKVRCINEHWYNADKFSACPYCGVKKGMGETAAAEEGTDISQGGKTEKKSKRNGIWSHSRSKTEKQEPDSTGGVPGAGEINQTGKPGQGGARLEEVPGNRWNDIPPTEPMFSPGGGFVPFFRAPEQGTSWKDKAPKGIDDIKTISIYADEQGEEPVTGWLVCVQGVYRGISFPLKTGVNVIGRDEKSYVCLRRDAQVSRSRHAVLIYEPKQKVFYIGEGESSLTYCNGELVYGKRQLQAYDSIELGVGGGEYLFVPFCGEKFDWGREKERTEEKG